MIPDQTTDQIIQRDIIKYIHCSTLERKYGKSKADLEYTVIEVTDENAGSYEHELSPLSHLHVLWNILQR